MVDRHCQLMFSRRLTGASEYMYYFIKNVDSPTDKAICSNWVEHSSLPFVILAFDGFRCPLASAEAAFFVDLLSLLPPAGNDLLACRVAPLARDDYAHQARHQFAEVSLEINCGWLYGRATFNIHVITERNRVAFADLLKRYWKTSAGHWVFCDSRATVDSINRIKEVFAESGRKVSKLHYKLLTTSLLAAASFDDQLLDCFVRRPVDEVERTMRMVAREHSISLLC